MRRILLLAATWISLALFLVLTALYARSWSRRDEVNTTAFRHHILVATFPHHLHIILAKHASRHPFPWDIKFGLLQISASRRFLEPRFSSNTLYWTISVPLWLPMLVVSALPLWWLFVSLRRRRLRRKGLCINCAYDVRACIDRCSECGQPLPTISLAEAYRASAEEDVRIVKE